MSLFNHGDMPIFSISHDLFSDITAISLQRCPKRSLPTWEAKTKTKTPLRAQKLNVFNEWEVRRNEARKLEDISSKKDGHEYEPESLAVMQCSMDSHWKTVQKLQYFAGSWICKFKATTWSGSYITSFVKKAKIELAEAAPAISAFWNTL